jgi:hypothetical protein
MADGRTGYMHKSVVSEQPAQVASAAPAQPQAPQTRTLDTDASAFETMSAPAAPQPAAPQGGDVAAQAFAAGLQQLGINIPQQNLPQPQPQQQTMAAISFVPINETVTARAGALIFDQPGGRNIFKLTKSGPLLASQRSSDGRWYGVSLPNGQTGYIARQSLTQ